VRMRRRSSSTSWTCGRQRTLAPPPPEPSRQQLICRPGELERREERQAAQGWRGGRGCKTSLASGRSKRPRRPCPARAHVGLFLFFFFSSFFFQQFFLYISYMHNSSLWKKLCTQLDVYRKIYAHNLLLEKKNIHTSYS
jgi:hypothetical protein